ncbi:hypothetical protein CHS0354_041320 [Potamilus streckersoni]|uniref:Uncharacterized protein n=1 Tax=Potamilus streckersoni TaxID=2493646 RepID=A0AAE0SE57_9BIVA|nr:hypothetical protein CHS0354_041320 [Potamilus streckersoni]
MPLSQALRFSSLGVLAISVLFQVIALCSPGWHVEENDGQITSTGPIMQTTCHKGNGTCTSRTVLENIMSTRQDTYFTEWIFSMQMFHMINTLITIVVPIAFCLVVFIFHVFSIWNRKAGMYLYPVGTVSLAVACTLQFSLTVTSASMSSVQAHYLVYSNIQTPWSLVLYGLSSFFSLVMLVGYFTMLIQKIKLQARVENIQMEENSMEESLIK